MAPFATSKLLLVAMAGLAALMSANSSPLPDEPGYASYPTGLSARDDTLPPDQILSECPGGTVGSSDKCTFEPNGQTDTVYRYVLSQSIANCEPGATSPATDMKRVTESETSGFTMSASVAVGPEFEGIGSKIKIEGSISQSDTKATYEGLTVTANPGKQAALVVQQEYTRHYGRIRANYGSRRNGHYIWYVNGVSYDEIKPGAYARSGQSFDCNQSPAGVIDGWNQDAKTKHYDE